jgi:hypothetical protein
MGESCGVATTLLTLKEGVLMRQHVSCTTKVSNEKPYRRGQASALLTTGDMDSDYVTLPHRHKIAASAAPPLGLALRSL